MFAPRDEGGGSSDPRLARLYEPHVEPLTRLISVIRDRAGGQTVPNVDPNDGGINAPALFLLESPGPKAAWTDFVSRDNPDPSARNMTCALRQAEFTREQTLLWNVVPQCVSTPEKNRNATRLQVRRAVPDTEAFVAALRVLRVIVFCGRRAQWQRSMLTLI
jgi:hypothetical protein